MSVIGSLPVGDISGISSVRSNSLSAAESGSANSFASVLSDAISMVENTNTDSNAATLNLLTGNTDDLSSALITTEKAQIALNLTVAIRNKAVDAYKEIMNMQV